MKKVFLAIMFRTNTWAGELFAFLLVKDFFDGTDERFAGKSIFPAEISRTYAVLLTRQIVRDCFKWSDLILYTYETGSKTCTYKAVFLSLRYLQQTVQILVASQLWKTRAERQSCLATERKTQLIQQKHICEYKNGIPNLSFSFLHKSLKAIWPQYFTISLDNYRFQS